MQRGLGTFLNSGGSDRSSMLSSFSELEEGVNNDSHHPLIQQVKNNCGLQDDNQARMYTQQATGFLRENANNDPQGLSSLFGGFGGGQQGGGGIGNLVGGMLGSGSGGNKQDSIQQPKKKGARGLGESSLKVLEVLRHLMNV